MERQVSVAQLSLAWLLHQSSVTSVILGTKSEEQLAENLGASRVRLSPNELAALDRASALPPEYPGWMLARQGEYRRKQLVDQNRPWGCFRTGLLQIRQDMNCLRCRGETRKSKEGGHDACSCDRGIGVYRECRH